MSNVKIIRAECTHGRMGGLPDERMTLEVGINATFGESRVIHASELYGYRNYNGGADPVAHYREAAIRDMARNIAHEVERQIIEALQDKARQARPVSIVDAFK